jgi:hypothetical protein
LRLLNDWLKTFESIWLLKIKINMKCSNYFSISHFLQILYKKSIVVKLFIFLWYIVIY